MGLYPSGKHSSLIAAQISVIAAFALSVSTYSAWGWIPGLVSLVMLVLATCCHIGKCTLVAAGVFAILAAILQIIMIIIAAITDYSDNQAMNAGAFYSVAGISIFLWISTAILCMVAASSMVFHGGEKETTAQHAADKTKDAVNAAIPHGDAEHHH